MLHSVKSLPLQRLALVASRVSSGARLAPIRHLSNQTTTTPGQVLPATKKETTPASDLGLVKEHGAPVGEPVDAPDYSAVTDYRTSHFSPVPTRVLDGSEPGTTIPAAVVSGAPLDLQARTVRIYKPTKSATQSGTWHGLPWLMDWDPLPHGHRWENPLMGWQSSADFMQGYRIEFKTKEDAIRFAEKQGYEYFVQEPNVRKFTPKQYASNFTHSPKKLKIIRTK